MQSPAHDFGRAWGSCACGVFLGSGGGGSVCGGLRRRRSSAWSTAAGHGRSRPGEGGAVFAAAEGALAEWFWVSRRRAAAPGPGLGCRGWPVGSACTGVACAAWLTGGALVMGGGAARGGAGLSGGPGSRHLLVRGGVLFGGRSVGSRGRSPAGGFGRAWGSCVCGVFAGHASECGVLMAGGAGGGAGPRGGGLPEAVRRGGRGTGVRGPDSFRVGADSRRRPGGGPPTGRRPGRLPMSRCGFPPRDPAGRLREQRLNRCVTAVQLSKTSRTRRTTAVCGLPGQRTVGRAAQSFPTYVPRQRNSEEVPQDILRCQPTPPKTLPDIVNLDRRTPSMVTFTSL